MASRRRTRAGGGSTSGRSSAGGSAGGAEDSLLDESFAGLDPNDLLQMLGGDDDEELLHGQEGEEDEEDEEGEERDIVTALEGKFCGAIAAPPEKRKRSEGRCCRCHVGLAACAPVQLCLDPWCTTAV